MAALLAPYGLVARSAGDLGLPEPEETGTTFEANAILKAVAAAKASGQVALADDSGLAVDALGGDPGVNSARWAGPDKDFAIAMRKVEDRLIVLGATTPAKRRARFVAVLCLAEPNDGSETFRGEVEGTLVWPPRGTNGFGYDPMFLPDGHDITFGEMNADAKHGWSHGSDGTLSHRARAFAAFARARLG
jgi:XTP/dITP diphosphohydrolase